MAKLYFYYSSMNAGKSTTLLQSSYNYRERGMNTILFAPSFDNRGGEDAMIASRIGLKEKAIPFDESTNIFDITYQKRLEIDNLKCVLIDEAQFLRKEQVAQLTRITNELSIPVLAYGLRTDFLGEPFEGSLYLLAWAEEITEIKTICHCGRKATMNIRIDSEGNAVTSGAQIEIGGNDRYLSVCMKHFRSVMQLADSQQLSL